MLHLLCANRGGFDMKNHRAEVLGKGLEPGKAVISTCFILPCLCPRQIPFVERSSPERWRCQVAFPHCSLAPRACPAAVKNCDLHKMYFVRCLRNVASSSCGLCTSTIQSSRWRPERSRHCCGGTELWFPGGKINCMCMSWPHW